MQKSYTVLRIIRMMPEINSLMIMAEMLNDNLSYKNIKYLHDDL